MLQEQECQDEMVSKYVNETCIENFREQCKELSNRLDFWSRQAGSSFAAESEFQMRNTIHVMTVLNKSLMQIKVNEPKGLRLRFRHDCCDQNGAVCRGAERKWDLIRPDQGDVNIRLESNCKKSLYVELVDQQNNVIQRHGQVRIWLTMQNCVNQCRILNRAVENFDLIQNCVVAHSLCQRCQNLNYNVIPGKGHCNEVQCVKDKPYLLLSNKNLPGVCSYAIDLEMKDGIVDLSPIRLTLMGERTKTKQLKHASDLQLIATMIAPNGSIILGASEPFKTIAQRTKKFRKRQLKQQQQQLQQFERTEVMAAKRTRVEGSPNSVLPPTDYDRMVVQTNVLPSPFMQFQGQFQGVGNQQAFRQLEDDDIEAQQLQQTALDVQVEMENEKRRQVKRDNGGDVGDDMEAENLALPIFEQHQRNSINSAIYFLQNLGQQRNSSFNLDILQCSQHKSLEEELKREPEFLH